MDIITPTAPRLQDSRDSEEVRKALLDLARQISGKTGSQRFGSYPSSYSEFDDEGNFGLYGDATCYNDINSPFASGKVPASNAPTWATTAGIHGAYKFAVNDYLQTGSREFEHSYKEGSDIELHIHWMPSVSDSTDRYVRWRISYMMANMSATFPTPATVEVETKIPAGTPALTHIYSSLGIVKCPGIKIGAYISTVVTRVASTGTAPSGNPFGLAVGIHYQMDSLGSRTTAGK